MLRLLIFASLFILLSACGTLEGAFPTGPTNPDPSGPGGDVSNEILQLVNSARASGFDCDTEGAFGPTSSLRISSVLTSTAQKHSEDMQAGNHMSHITPQGAIHYAPGSNPSERIDEEGYAWSALGENVARGYPDAKAVVDAWLESDGHCANIMSPNFTEIGIGKAELFWTQVFARPR